jgi:hypothetical protein
MEAPSTLVMRSLVSCRCARLVASAAMFLSASSRLIRVLTSLKCLTSSRMMPPEEPSENRTMTVQELYERSIKSLPTGDRLRLAAIILNDIPARAVVDYSEQWSDEDLADFSRATWEHINRSLDEEDDGQSR